MNKFILMFLAIDCSAQTLPKDNEYTAVCPEFTEGTKGYQHIGIEMLQGFLNSSMFGWKGGDLIYKTRKVLHCGKCHDTFYTNEGGKYYPLSIKNGYVIEGKNSDVAGKSFDYINMEDGRLVIYGKVLIPLIVIHENLMHKVRCVQCKGSTLEIKEFSCKGGALVFGGDEVFLLGNRLYTGNGENAKLIEMQGHSIRLRSSANNGYGLPVKICEKGIYVTLNNNPKFLQQNDY